MIHPHQGGRTVEAPTASPGARPLARYRAWSLGKWQTWPQGRDGLAGPFQTWGGGVPSRKGAVVRRPSTIRPNAVPERPHGLRWLRRGEDDSNLAENWAFSSQAAPQYTAALGDVRRALERQKA